jgi:hypothetical protein
MLVPRTENCGRRIALDLAADEFCLQSKDGLAAYKCESPLSATLELDRRTPRVWRQHSRIQGTVTWPTILDRIGAARVLRLNLAGIERISCSDLEALVQEAGGRRFGLVASARGCTPELVPRLKALRGVGLQIFFGPGKSKDAPRAISFKERLKILRECVETCSRVRVLTAHDLKSRMSLGEFGRHLALEGARHWRIYPRDATTGPASDLTAEEREEILRLCGEKHWQELKFGDFLDRELGIVVAPDGSVLSQAAPGLRPTYIGDVEQLAAGGLLSPATLKRHSALWITEVHEEYEEIAPSPEDGRLELAVQPTSPSYQAFLCYHRPDREFVITLRNRLEEARISTWLDQRDLEAGQLWRDAIEEAMENSQSTLIFIGPKGLGPVQKQEMDMALHLAENRGMRVIPVILPGVTDSFVSPAWLHGRHCVDFRFNDPDPFQELIRALRRGGSKPLESRLSPPR